MLQANFVLNSLAAVALLAAQTAAFAAPPQWAEGRILVQPAPGVSDAKLNAILAAAGGRSNGKVRALGTHLVEVPARAEARVIAALAHNPHIAFAEQDLLLTPEATTPNDPLWSDSNFWHLQKIEAPQAWDYSTGAGVIIAICDSGVDATHPDLAGQLVPGWNVVSDNADTSPVFGHGTKVAGVAAAASDNAQGIASAAWDAAIMPMRVTNRTDGAAYTSDIAAGITWAVDHGAQVVNASYAGLFNSSLVKAAGAYARDLGALVFVSAGNYNTDYAEYGFVDDPELIVVAASTSSDTKASFSNYGEYVDITAPGQSLWTTVQGGSYALVSGTSFSAPLAAGVAALIMAADPTLSPAQVEAILKDTADDPAGVDFHPYYGWGRINAGRAITTALSISPDTTAPSVTITAPGTGSTVSGSVSVTVAASDDTAVTAVELYANGTLLGVDSTAPYAFTLDTTQYANGTTLQLQALALDASQNSSTDAIAVTVSHAVADTAAPTVSFTNISDGDTVSGNNVTIQISAQDDQFVSLLQLYIDGSLHSASNDSNTLSYTWQIRKISAGAHTLKAVAVDAAGHQSSVTITVVAGDSQSSDTNSTGGKGRGKNK